MIRYRGLAPLMLLLLIVSATSARAGTSLSVEIGWEDRFRAARWTPLFVTLSDDHPRVVTLEVRSPHSGGQGLLVRQSLSATPTPTTYPVYLPLTWNTSDILVVVRDARTNRRLAQWPEDASSGATFWNQGVEVLIGTSGWAPTLRGFAGVFPHKQVDVAHVPPERLPLAPAGYDAFDALVLNQPDLTRITFEQQQAIADWVRAGGVLILWPSIEPWPLASPIAAISPVLVGETLALEIAPEALESAGLPSRFGNLRARALQPREGARRIEILDTPAAAAFTADAGFGQVIVLPFDPSLFVFEDDSRLRAFWQPIMITAVDEKLWDTSQQFRAWSSQRHQRHTLAVSTAADTIAADIPGVGQFGFGYVVVVLVGLMLIVGPVDWFLLKYLGRQPWTWFTTTGWIALVTLGAVMIGHVFRSGDLHLRTLRIVDQAAGQTLATSDLVCVYAPQTRVYEIDVEPHSFWQPVAGANLYRGRRTALDVPFLQDSVSNRPAPSIINVWNLRLLEGQSSSSAAPVVDARLTIVHEGAADSPASKRIVGTITNRSDVELRDVIVRIADGAVHLTGQRLLPGATVDVDHRLAHDAAVFGVEHLQWQGQRPSPLTAMPGAPITQTPRYWLLTNLAAGRAQRIDATLAERTDRACIYAEAVDPPPVVTMPGDRPIEQHSRIIRALVPIATEQP